MTKVKVNGVEINYHLDGEGEETIVLLNGIMMSTASWINFVPVFTEQNNYQLLRVDFRDQGLSSKFKKDYDVNIHVDDLKKLLDHLNINKVHMVGVSYGGMVAMLFALKYPETLSSLILSNTVAKVTKHLQAVSDLWEEAAKLNNGKQFFTFSMPLIYSDDFYNRKWNWLKERKEIFDKLLDGEWFEAFIRLSQSSKNFDILDMIIKINIPTLLVAGTRDQITPIHEMRKLKDRIPESRMIIIENAGHASFYEKMDEFNTAILGFIALHKS